MHFFANLSIRSKVMAAFAAILALTICLGVFSISRVRLLNNDAATIVANQLQDAPLSVMAKDARQLVTVAAVAADQTDPNAGSSIFDELTRVRGDYEANWGLYQSTMDPGREATDGNDFNAAFAQLFAAVSKMSEAYSDSDSATVVSLLDGDVKDNLHKFSDAMADDIAYNQGQSEADAAAANREARASIVLISVVLAILSGGAALVGFLLIRAVATPIGQMTDAMRRLAAQDFSVTIPGIGRTEEIGAMAAAVQIFKENAQERIKLEAAAAEFKNELDQKLKSLEAAFEAAGRDQKLIVEALAAALASLAKGDLTARVEQDVAADYLRLKSDFNKAIESFQLAMQGIAANTQGVRAGAEEITQASDDLARRTEQQAANLEQTAAALAEITNTVRKTAEDAGAARQVVSTAHDDAEQSGKVVRDAVEAMTGIETSSKQISNIIGVIDEIAFQTNLLALNAGVEAARAGDAGRGFAVVATEVRALAQRSADAAKEIKALISASGAQVKTGVRLVGETGLALTRIVEHVGRLNQLVTNIAGSAQEQATGLAEVNSAVNQMDQVTQQNAAMVEEATAASHGLAGEAEALAGLVGQFQIGGQAALPAQAPVRRRAAPVAGRFTAAMGLTGPTSAIAMADDGMEEF